MPSLKLHINARQAVADIRSGMSDADLMAKYKLSEKTLATLFRRLVAGGVLRQDELDARLVSLNAAAHVPPCPACGKPGSEADEECPYCGVVLAKFTEKQASEHSAKLPSLDEVLVRGGLHGISSGQKKRLPELPLALGAIGCVLLLLGAFLPVLNVPHQGRLNFFQLGETAPGAPALACFIIALGLASATMVATKHYRWLWVSGVGCLVVLGYTFTRLRQSISRIMSQVGALLEGRLSSAAGQKRPLTGLQDPVQQMFAFQMDWGWVVLCVGAVLLLAAALLAAMERSNTEPLRGR